MAQACLNLRLTVKTPDRGGVTSSGGQHLDRNYPAEMGVRGLINLTHPARTQKLSYAVLANQHIQQRRHNAAFLRSRTLPGLHRFHRHQLHSIANGDGATDRDIRLYAQCEYRDNPSSVVEHGTATVAGAGRVDCQLIIVTLKYLRLIHPRSASQNAAHVAY